MILRLTLIHDKKRVVIMDPVPLSHLAEDQWLIPLVAKVVGEGAVANGKVAKQIGACMAFCLPGDVKTWMDELVTDTVSDDELIAAHAALAGIATPLGSTFYFGLNDMTPDGSDWHIKNQNTGMFAVFCGGGPAGPRRWPELTRDLTRDQALDVFAKKLHVTRANRTGPA
jgi:hypothetical protein